MPVLDLHAKGQVGFREGLPEAAHASAVDPLRTHDSQIEIRVILGRSCNTRTEGVHLAFRHVLGQNAFYDFELIRSQVNHCESLKPPEGASRPHKSSGRS